jgi:hypothetical protein
MFALKYLFSIPPKGSSASIPQTVKKQKLFFCLFFFVGSLERNLNLDLD